MENSLKQRIVGAVVLVALAVIFLPAILKEKRTAEPFESQIPEKPVELLNKSMSEESKERVAKSQQKLDNLTKEKDSEGTEKELSDKTDESSERKQKVEVAKSQTKSEIADRTEKTDKKSKENNQSKASNLKDGSSEKQEQDTIGKEFKDAAWLIQVASFSSQENAERMVVKLKAAKHKAYSRKGKSQKKTIYRIYVGPFIEKTRAEKSLNTVNAVSETKGILIPYDPIKH